MRNRQIIGVLFIVGGTIAMAPAAKTQNLYVGPSNAYAQSMADRLLNNQQAQRPVVQRLGALVGPKLRELKKITSVIISVKCDHYTTMDATFDDGTTQSLPYTDKVAAGDADALRALSPLIHVVADSCED
jgi:hypothetical protein